jgi:hypothetical protein
MNCQLTYKMTSRNFPIFPYADPENPISIANHTHTYILLFFMQAIPEYLTLTAGDILSTCLNYKVKIKS